MPASAQTLKTPPDAASGPEADAELARRAAQGDRAAFAQLLADNYDFMFRTAYKWCGSREDAEDICQDVCIKLARNVKSYDGRARFSTWLYRVVLNAVRDMQRRKTRHNRRVGEFKNTVSHALEPDQESQTLHGELWSAIRRLPERQRDAMLLVYAEDKPHAEAARIMKCREATVSGHIHAAKKTLKKLL